MTGDEGDEDAVAREFDMLMRKAGAVVPADRRAGMVKAYRDMKAATALLRQPRTAAAEPSNVFSLTPYLPGGRP